MRLIILQKCKKKIYLYIILEEYHFNQHNWLSGLICQVTLEGRLDVVGFSFRSGQTGISQCEYKTFGENIIIYCVLTRLRKINLCYCAQIYTKTNQTKVHIYTYYKLGSPTTQAISLFYVIYELETINNTLHHDSHQTFHKKKITLFVSSSHTFYPFNSLLLLSFCI